jgi:hypothetical protein
MVTRQHFDARLRAGIAGSIEDTWLVEDLFKTRSGVSKTGLAFDGAERAQKALQRSASSRNTCCRRGVLASAKALSITKQLNV